MSLLKKIGCFGAVRRSLIERRVDDMPTALHTHFLLSRIKVTYFIFILKYKNCEQMRTKSSEYNEYNCFFR